MTSLSHLDRLESEAVEILRDGLAGTERPVRELPLQLPVLPEQDR